MRIRCAHLLSCIVLATCVVAGVSVKGLLDDVDDDVIDKRSAEDAEKDAPDKEGAKKDVFDNGSTEDVKEDVLDKDSQENVKKEFLDTGSQENAKDVSDKESSEDVENNTPDKGSLEDVENNTPDKGSLENIEKNILGRESPEYVEKEFLDINSTITNTSSKHYNYSLQSAAETDRSLHKLNNNNDIETDDEFINNTKDNKDRDGAKTSEDQDLEKTSRELSNSESLEDVHLESSVYEKSHKSIRLNNLTSSNHDPKHGALVTRKIDTADLKRGKVNSEEDSDLSTNVGKERKPHRKKRLQPSSSAPSAQLIILVVGAVLACVLITGFIRWRVRRRLNAKKLKQMSENLSTYRGKKEFPKKSLMDTIYECDCEHGLETSPSRDMGILAYSELSQEEDGVTKLDEDSSSHRFEVPPSVSGSSYCDVCSYGHLPLKASKSGTDSSRSHRRHHGHRSKSSRHHKRKSHDKKHAQQTDSIDTECNSPDFEFTKSSSFDISLLEQGGNSSTQNSTIGQHSMDPTSLPSLLQQANSNPSRRVLGSLVDTWRSLSFNRDWVGRMWQEKHGVRRISDVLRGLPPTSDPDRENSSQENLQVEGDTLKPVTLLKLSEEIEMSASTRVETEGDTVSNEICDKIAIVGFMNQEQTCEDLIERNLTNENSLTAVQSDWSSPRGDCHVDNSASSHLVEAEPSQMSRTGAMGPSMSFSDQFDEPPGYNSFMDSGRWSMNSLARSGVDHSRHHRRHRRRHRDRNSRHLYSRVKDDDHEDQMSSYDHEELEPLTSIHRSHDQPSTSNLELHDAESTIISNCQTTTGQGQHNIYPNSASNLGTSAMAVPFSQQEGIIIEQLSDGAQIIYVPPPALPSYHNDTPPPYHK